MQYTVCIVFVEVSCILFLGSPEQYVSNSDEFTSHKLEKISGSVGGVVTHD